MGGQYFRMAQEQALGWVEGEAQQQENKIEALGEWEMGVALQNLGGLGLNEVDENQALREEILGIGRAQPPQADVFKAHLSTQLQPPPQTSDEQPEQPSKPNQNFAPAQQKGQSPSLEPEIMQDCLSPAKHEQSPVEMQTKSLTQVLQERMQRLEERHKRSQKMRAVIIKLEPVATKRESELRAAINGLKMAETANFLSRKEERRAAATEWRQEPSKQSKIQRLIAETPSPKKKSSSLPKFPGISPVLSKKQSSSREKKKSVLPQMGERIMPYNVYNLYQRKPELFKLSSLAAP